MYNGIVPHNIADLYKQAAERYGNKPAIADRKKNSDFLFTSYEEIFEIGKNLATGLIALGLCPREYVGVLAHNCVEWVLIDCAVQVAGAVNVPCGTSSTENEIAHILHHSESRFVFVENTTTWEKFNTCFPLNAHKILMKRDGKESLLPEGHYLLLEDLIIQGSALRKAGNRVVEERLEQIQPEDLFTMIYTSGATGIPKGVQLTHANAVSQIRNVPFCLNRNDRALSILPIWHSYERIFELISFSWGIITYYASLRSITKDFELVRPTIMCSAPRLWERVYQRVLNHVHATSFLQRWIFYLSYGIAERVKTAESFFHGNLLDLHGRTLIEKIFLAIIHGICWLVGFLPYHLLNQTVLRKIRAIIGGRLRGTISGGGALQPHVDKFFNFIGIPVLEGYGLTETSPIIAVRTWENLTIGTVGPPYPETEIRIIGLKDRSVLYPDPSRTDQGCGRIGEIHVRGPQVMKGYYKNDITTRHILENGWLNTGDIGMITFNNCLKILGRSKDTIVLLSGENVEPLPLEVRLLNSPFIEQCMVIGQDEKHLGALIVPHLKAFASVGIVAKNLSELATYPQLTPRIDKEIRRFINRKNGIKVSERIVPWRIIPKAFETGDELTHTFKLRREVIAQKYSELIREMFQKE